MAYHREIAGMMPSLQNGHSVPTQPLTDFYVISTTQIDAGRAKRKASRDA